MAVGKNILYKKIFGGLHNNLKNEIIEKCLKIPSVLANFFSWPWIAF